MALAVVSMHDATNIALHSSTDGWYLYFSSAIIVFCKLAICFVSRGELLVHHEVVFQFSFCLATCVVKVFEDVSLLHE